MSWQCIQTKQSPNISGYRIYLNGKQYGTDLPDSITNIRIKVNTEFKKNTTIKLCNFYYIKLSLDKVLHTIFITSFCTKPFSESEYSNIIEISTERFLQFSFFCYKHTHIKNAV